MYRSVNACILQLSCMAILELNLSDMLFTAACTNVCTKLTRSMAKVPA